jgi:hypothetical protein
VYQSASPSSGEAPRSITTWAREKKKAERKRETQEGENDISIDDFE